MSFSCARCAPRQFTAAAVEAKSPRKVADTSAPANPDVDAIDYAVDKIKRIVSVPRNPISAFPMDAIARPNTHVDL